MKILVDPKRTVLNVPGISKTPGKPEDKPGFDGVGGCPCRCLPQN